MNGEKQDILHELLVLRYRQGDASALEELIRRWERPLFYYVRRLLDREEDAWDALQDVWLKVTRQIHKLHDPKALPAWLYTIAHNTVMSYYRKTRRFEVWNEDGESPEECREEIHLDVDPDDVLDLHRAIESLSLPHREVITLHFMEDFSLAEISAITGVSAGTVKSRLHYAKLALRKALTGDASEAGAKGERHA